MTPQWKDVFLDIETDAVEDGVTTKLHSLVVRDVETDEVISCAPLEHSGRDTKYLPFSMGLDVLRSAERIYGHNIIKFDSPQVAALTGFRIPWEKLRDTMVIAGMRWTNTKETDGALVRAGKMPSDLVGKNTLDAWGRRIGVLKGAFGASKPKKKRGQETEEDKRLNREKWAQWTPEMQTYCEQDTLVGTALVRYIRKHGVTPLSVETEQELCAYLDKQEQNGWPFNVDKAVALQGKLSARRQELEEELRKLFKFWFKPETYKGHVVTHVAKSRLGVLPSRPYAIEKGAEYTKVEVVHFNPGSRAHIADRLQKLYGWKPTEFTPSGEPRIDEDIFDQMPKGIPGVELLKEYLLVVKRLGQLAEGDNAWLKCITKDRRRGGKLTGRHHIHHVCLQSGTITHRAAHIWPNLAQVPKVTAPYGVECRELFEVPEGWVQIGADASGLELRELSHYMARFDGGKYGRTVTEGKNEDGTDIHSVNRDALGLTGKPGRDAAKTFIYAFLYGSGDLNLGQMLGVSDEELKGFKATKGFLATKARLKKRQQPFDDYTTGCAMKGAKLRASFLKNLPALNSLINEVKAKAKKQGYLTLHDGRRVPIRYAHAALNSLLQGSGAVVCKRWIVRFNRRLTAEFGEQGWEGKWASLGWIHDEIQLAVRPEIAERVKQILVEEIRATGIEFNLRIALDGEAKSGPHWAACH
jgi:DNA polymerase-1